MMVDSAFAKFTGVCLLLPRHLKFNHSIFVDTSNKVIEVSEARTLSCEFVDICKGLVQRAGPK